MSFVHPSERQRFASVWVASKESWLRFGVGQTCGALSFSQIIRSLFDDFIPILSRVIFSCSCLTLFLSSVDLVLVFPVTILLTVTAVSYAPSFSLLSAQPSHSLPTFPEVTRSLSLYCFAIPLTKGVCLIVERSN